MLYDITIFIFALTFLVFFCNSESVSFLRFTLDTCFFFMKHEEKGKLNMQAQLY